MIDAMTFFASGREAQEHRSEAARHEEKYDQRIADFVSLFAPKEESGATVHRSRDPEHAEARHQHRYADDLKEKVLKHRPPAG